MVIFVARKKYVRKPWHLEDETAEAVREAAMAAAQKGRYPDSRKHFIWTMYGYLFGLSRFKK